MPVELDLNFVEKAFCVFPIMKFMVFLFLELILGNRRQKCMIDHRYIVRVSQMEIDSFMYLFLLALQIQGYTIHHLLLRLLDFNISG